MGFSFPLKWKTIPASCRSMSTAGPEHCRSMVRSAVEYLVEVDDVHSMNGCIITLSCETRAYMLGRECKDSQHVKSHDSPFQIAD